MEHLEPPISLLDPLQEKLDSPLLWGAVVGALRRGWGEEGARRDLPLEVAEEEEEGEVEEEEESFEEW